MNGPDYVSDAKCCADCPHCHDGAMIEGIEYPEGWHCDINDAAGTHRYAAAAYALCRVPGMWDELEDAGESGER